jgi:hypothetical protein
VDLTEEGLRLSFDMKHPAQRSLLVPLASTFALKIVPGNDPTIASVTFKISKSLREDLKPKKGAKRAKGK